MTMTEARVRFSKAIGIQPGMKDGADRWFILECGHAYRVGFEHFVSAFKVGDRVACLRCQQPPPSCGALRILSSAPSLVCIESQKHEGDHKDDKGRTWAQRQEAH